MKSEEGKRHALPCILTARWAASPISSSRQHAIIKRLFLPCNSLFVLPLPSSTKVLKINAHLASEAVRYFQFLIKIVNDVIIVYIYPYTFIKNIFNAHPNDTHLTLKVVVYLFISFMKLKNFVHVR
jgi:hypothetical protein